MMEPLPLVFRSVETTPVKARLVEVAFASVVLPVTDSVPVAVMLLAVRLPLKNPLPATESVAKGEVVPMPTLPPEEILKYVDKLDEDTRKRSDVCPKRP